MGRQEVLIAGVGNELLGDEGLGVHVIRALAQSRSRISPDVDLLDLGTGVFDLLDVISCYRCVFIVDAVCGGQGPGFRYRMDLLADLQNPAAEPEWASLHGSDLTGVLRIAASLGRLPQEVTLIGVEPERIEYGLDLTPAVRQAAENICAELIAELEKRSESPGCAQVARCQRPSNS